MVVAREGYLLGHTEQFQELLWYGDTAKLCIRLHYGAVVHVCSPESCVFFVESYVELRSYKFGLTLPFLECVHLETLLEDILPDYESHISISRHNALEGGRENYSSLVVYLAVIFADEFDHSILHAN